MVQELVVMLAHQFGVRRRLGRRRLGRLVRGDDSLGLRDRNLAVGTGVNHGLPGWFWCAVGSDQVDDGSAQM